MSISRNGIEPGRFHWCRRFPKGAPTFLLLSMIACTPTENRDSPVASPPAWARTAVWYQIFPERFRNGDPGNDPAPGKVALAWPFSVPDGWKTSDWTGDWYEPSAWELSGGKGFYEYVGARRYGGDLQGVLDKLPYLQDLGVTALYLNPIFESPSSHKYDASCYHHIDLNFGPDPAGDAKLMLEEDPADTSSWRWSAADRLFLLLIKEAHGRGMKVIIDGVFNHVGTTFWAFRDVRRNGERSRYKDWFTVTRWDDEKTGANEFDYQGWMGIKDLPEFREDEDGLAEGPREHIRAVVRRWMDPDGDGDPSDGIDGWRLDVAEKVSIPFWRDFRNWVRAVNPQAYLVGEVWWEDWRRGKMFNAAPWLQGDVFDAVMNYRWAREVCRFFKDSTESITASELGRRLKEIQDDYPSPVNPVLMNLFGSHDTDRLASMIVNVDTEFDKRVSAKDNPRYIVRRPTQDERRIQKLMVLFQMTYLGAPMVYYGDEAGMWGGDDPDCRKPMLWEDLKYSSESHDPLGRPRPADVNLFDADLFSHYRQLIHLRRENGALAEGDVRMLAADDAKGVLAFLRSQGGQHVLVAVNRSRSDRTMSIPIPAGLGGKVLKDLRVGGVVPATGSSWQVSIPAIDGVILKVEGS